MSKRSLGDAVEEAGASKRPKPTPSIPSENLALLRNYCTKLHSLVNAAENGATGEVTAALDRLVALNKTALPVLQALGGEEAAPTPAMPQPVSEARTQTPLHGAVIPSLENMTVWTVEDIPSGYPPLPPIPDPRLERMALTHRGISPITNYETLEFLGDSFIYHAASEIITQTFPELTPGRKSQMREGLLRNSNLAKYTLHYGIERHANFPPEFTGGTSTGGTKVAVKEREKVHGDLFESYVGALIRARPPAGQDPGYDGVAVALRWLRSLWAMSLAREIERKYGVRRNKPPPPAAPGPQAQLPMQQLINRAVAATGGTALLPAAASPPAAETPKATADAASLAEEDSGDQNDTRPQRVLPAKVQLAALIGCKEVKIRYEATPTKKVMRDKHSGLRMFTIAAWVDAWGTSECLGYGSALSKTEAGEKAAARALENKARMKFYVSQKAKFYGHKTAASAAVPEEAASEETQG